MKSCSNEYAFSKHHLPPVLEEILILLMGFTLEIINRIHHPKDVFHLGFPSIADQQVHCSLMANRVRFKVRTNSF